MQTSASQELGSLAFSQCPIDKKSKDEDENEDKDDKEKMLAMIPNTSAF